MKERLERLKVVKSLIKTHRIDSQDSLLQLLAEAGYPNGVDEQTRQPLVINLDTTSAGVFSFRISKYSCTVVRGT